MEGSRVVAVDWRVEMLRRVERSVRFVEGSVGLDLGLAVMEDVD